MKIQALVTLAMAPINVIAPKFLLYYSLIGAT